jgi:hypothetical protein
MLAKIFDKQESDGYEKKSTSSYKEKIVKPNDSTCYTLDQATFNPGYYYCLTKDFISKIQKYQHQLVL